MTTNINSLATPAPPTRADSDRDERGLALSVRGLRKSFGTVHAVRGIDLHAHVGECLGLLGPNGAGKTTTIEILEGLQSADAGDVVVLGGAPGSRQVRERIGIALQETRLPEKSTVQEAVQLFRSLYRRGRTVDEVIAHLELDEKRHARVGQLSGGQKQRLALACALVGDPELLFLDEPSTGLDPQSRLKVWEIVLAFKARGGTVVLTTHYMEEAARLCDRLAIVDHGEIIALGTTAELLLRLGARQMVEIITSPVVDDAIWAALPVVARLSRRADQVLLHSDNAAALLPAALACAEGHGVAVRQLSTREATLEDVFVHLTGQGLRDG